MEEEIRGRIDEFKASIETKLAAPAETTTATPEPADDGINTPTEVVAAVQEVVSEKSQEALRALEKSGILPDNWIKNLLKFFHDIF